MIHEDTAIKTGTEETPHIIREDMRHDSIYIYIYIYIYYMPYV